MPISHALWTVGSAPTEVPLSILATEQQLEDMIVAEPRILSEEWLLIGQQEATGRGGRVDLLAIAPDGSIVLVELKRDRTPREVVAQALDYASWVEHLEPEHIAAIYARFRPGRSLPEDFREHFGQPLDEETVNGSHQVVVVAASLDASTERIIGYRAWRSADAQLNFRANMRRAKRIVQCDSGYSEPRLAGAWLMRRVATDSEIHHVHRRPASRVRAGDAPNDARRVAPRCGLNLHCGRARHVDAGGALNRAIAGSKVWRSRHN